MTHRNSFQIQRLLARGAGVLACSVFLMTGCAAPAAAKEKLPEVSQEGLKLVPKTKVSAVYLRDGISFAGYDKVAILECYVAFRKDWKRDQNSGVNRFKVSDSDMQRIKTELAEEFKKVFTERLTEMGETVVNTAGPGVLILRPAIINLDVVAPETMDPGSRTYSETAGSATLYLEIYDAVTSELLVRAIDNEVAGDNFVTVRNGVTNRGDARLMLKKWADLLGKFLQNSRETVNPAAAKK
jgi:hypothetical protein